MVSHGSGQQSPGSVLYLGKLLSLLVAGVEAGGWLARPWRCRFRWKLRPHWVSGDTTYGTVENIVSVEAEGIRAYMPLPETDKHSPLFRQRDFTWDEEPEAYVCPRGELLIFSHRVYSKEITIYRAEGRTCHACPLKAKCTTSSNVRSISRSFHEECLARVREYHQTEAYQKARRKRQLWMEP
ncbi:MAG: transposase [Chloroflexota bacterium]|nr:transposase [Chloroflexota bacterium]